MSEQSACAGGELTPDDHDWHTYEQVSYSYQNQYTNEPVRSDLHPRMAVLADKNPLFTVRHGRLIFDRSKPLEASSHGHAHRGQNILTLDGTVTWTVRPVVVSPDSQREDNIWLANDIDHYEGNEQPGSADDSFLVP